MQDVYPLRRLEYIMRYRHNIRVRESPGDVANIISFKSFTVQSTSVQ